MTPHLLRVALLLSAHIGHAHAYRSYMINIPNAGRVPCGPGTASSSTCHAGICEAFGHVSCAPADARTAFGEQYGGNVGGGGGNRRLESPPLNATSASATSFPPARDAEGPRRLSSGSSGLAWSVSICSADSDNDGYSNGDELGDPCCGWSQDPSDASLIGTVVTNPSDPLSFPATQSCTFGGAPAAPTGVGFTYVSSSSVTVTWTAPVGACVCEYRVTPTVGGVVLPFLRTRQTTYTLCELPHSTNVSIQVVAVNRGSTSTPAVPPAANSTLPAAGAANTAACSAPSVVIIDSTGNKAALGLGFDPQTALLWPLLVLLGASAVGALTLYCWVDPSSPARDALVHKYVGAGSGLAAMATPRASLGVYLLYCGAIAGLFATWLTSYVFYEKYMVYGLGQKASAERALGYTLACAVGLQLLPVTRFSVWLHVFGVPFERGVRFHRWIGLVTMLLCVLHGALMAWEMSGSKLGLGWLVVWSSADPVNPAAGLISGLLMLTMGVLAIGPVRRSAYELFLVGHSLWPLVLLFGYLHTSNSQTPALYPFAPGFLLLLLDLLLLGADLLWRPTHILDCGPIYADGAAVTASGDKARPIAAYVVLQKEGLGWWSFSYVPGQYVYLALPGVSLWPHPYSISSAPNPAMPGRFTIHVRSMGVGTWSGRAVDHLCAAAASVSLSLVTAESPHAQSSPLGWVAHANQHPQALPTTATTGTSRVYPSGAAGGPAPVSSTRSMGPSTFYAAAAARLMPSIRVMGPFGAPSVQLERYAHFVLIAGGIGITPIACLHASLSRGVAVAPCFPFPFLSAPAGADNTRRAHVSSLATVWSCRERGLLHEFAPLLAAPRSSTATGETVTAPAGPSSDAAAAASAIVPIYQGHAGQAPGESTPQVSLVAAGPAPSPRAYGTGSGRAAGHRLNVPVVSATVFLSKVAEGRSAAGASSTATGPGALPHLTTPSPHHASPEGPLTIRNPDLDAPEPWPGVAVRTGGRPDIPALLAAAATTALQLESGGAKAGRIPIAIVVCGPEAMVESVFSAAAAFASSPSGAAVALHIHRETFLL